VHQTHYNTLDVDENASSEMIEFAYRRLLKDAKDKLQDSPLYLEKEQNLKHAFQILSSPSLRQAYNNKLAKERTIGDRSSHAASDPFNAAEFFGGLFFSKAFLGSVVLIIVLLVLVPGGEERTVRDVVNKQMDYGHDIRSQQMDLERRQEDRYVASQKHNEYLSTRSQEQKAAAEQRRFEMDERRLELKEQREEARIAREDRRLAMQEEREARRTEYDLKRKAERERREEKYKKRQEEYEAQRRSREAVARINRTGEIQRDIEKLKAGY